jgi:hypothetical protein
VGSDEADTQGELPEESDDLTSISELSLATAGRLRRAGVRTYADLAALPVEEIARITRRSPKRVAELDWVGQARRLATGSQAGEDSPEAPAEEDRQRYESFMVRLLLESDNSVRRLSAQHTRSLREETWNGWETGKLLDFIARLADVRTEPGPARDEVATVAPPGPQAPRALDTPARPTRLQLKEVEVASAVQGYPGLTVPAGEPFTVRFMIDLGPLDVRGRSPLEYSASVVAKRFGREHRTVGETSGKLEGAAAELIEVHSDGLPEGTYQLKIAVRLRDPATSQPVAFAALHEGQVLHAI